MHTVETRKKTYFMELISVGEKPNYIKINNGEKMTQMKSRQ